MTALVYYAFGARHWAFGLTWMVSEKPDTEALTDAVEIGADVYTTRDGRQYGIGTRPPGQRQAAYPAALAVLETGRTRGLQRWAAAFSLPNGQWWCLEVPDDDIPPDGDRVFETEAACKSHFGGLLNQGNWQKLRVPSTWFLLGDEHMLAPASRLDDIDLEEILASTKIAALKTTRFELPEWLQLRGDRKLRVRGGLTAAVVLVGSAVALVWGQLHHQGALSAIQIAKLSPIEPAFARNNCPVGQHGAFPDCYELLPTVGKELPSSFLRRCVTAAIGLEDLIPHGWLVTGGKCDPSGYHADLARAGGLIDDLQSSIGTQLSLTITDPPETSAVLFPLDPEMVLRGDARATKSDHVRISLYSATELLGEKLALTSQPANATGLPWSQSTYALSLTTSFDPAEWGPIFDEIPGALVTEVTFKRPFTSFTILGVLYAAQ